MDPVSLIVTALVIGASSGLKETASVAVKDAYAGLKRLIGDKYAVAHSDMEKLEQDPASKGRRTVLEEVLGKAGAATDSELKELAEVLLSVVKEQDPDAARTFGLDISNLLAKEFESEGIVTTGGAGSATGVRLADAEIEGRASFKNVQTSGGANDPKA